MTMDAGYYEGQRRNIEDQYAAQMASNTYAKTLSQNRGNRDISFMRESFGRNTPNFTSSFGQRGFGGSVGKSGVMQRAMSNYLGDFNRDYSNAQNDLTEGLRQYDLQAAQLGTQRSGALSQIDLDKQREVSFAAQNIMALRSVLGGL